MDGYSLGKLFGAYSPKGRCLRHAIFLNASLAVSNYLNDSPLKEGDDYWFCENEEEIIGLLSPLLVAGKNVVICGFPQWENDQVPKILKKVNLDSGNPFLFFSSPSSKANHDYWVGRHATVEKSGLGLGGYIRRIQPDYIAFDTISSNFEDTVLIGLRDTQRQRFISFWSDTSKLICQINGLPGVGKSTFIQELCYRRDIESALSIKLYRSITFRNFLSSLAQKLKVLHDETFSDALLMQSIFNRVVEIQNFALVVHDANVLFQEGSDFEQFLQEWIIQHQNVEKPNKVILLSEGQISYQNELITQTSVKINLPLLSQSAIYALSQKLRPTLEYALDNNSFLLAPNQQEHDKTLYEITGGHPGTLSKLLEFCSKGFGIEALLEEDDLKLEFFSERDKYLEQLFTTGQEEDQLLEFLSLFEIRFELDAIRELYPKPFRMVEQLTGRAMLEVFHEYGITYYEIPSIIRNYYIYRLSEEDKALYRDRISRYYEFKDLRSS